ncbi:hypothetical protein ACS0TY_016854 [Phlomoides rotata]
MRTLSRKNIEILILLKAIMRRNVLIMAFAFAFFWMHRAKRLRNNNRRWFSLLERIPTQVKNLSDLVDVSDDDCKNVLRMDRLTFSRFCNVLVSDGGVNMDACMEAEKGKVTRGRRSWTKVEEDALIQCLAGIVNDGWKADNGFKAGFHKELEKGMCKLITGADILAPAYYSKIHVWKKEYGNLSDLLGKSGIGWNSTTYTLDIIDETVWDAQKRVDHTVKALRDKSFPYYDHWVDIFGKDRAIGENARDPTDIVDDIHQSGMENQGETGEKLTPDVPKTVEINVTNSVCKPSGSIDVGSTKGKKPTRKGHETKFMKK